MSESSPIEAGTPTVTLAGRQWPIPELAPRQLREIREPIIELNRRIAAEARDGKVDAFTKFTGNEYEQLLLKPVFVALTRANKTLSYDEFLDMPLTDGELASAWFVVRDQSGIFVKTAAKEGGGADAPAGEARAPSHGTGTAS